ncbi:MAG: CNP1-like family protein [Neisseria sp.]|nr:CNP1-like family protein [Neisseria sp.]
MKKSWLILLALCAASTAFAKKDQYNPGFDHEDEPWQEQKEDLPPFPALDDAAWQSFSVSNTFIGTPSLLLSSVYRAPDRSVRYVLNIRSEGGYDNLSAEGINCKEGTYKAFAFGDTVNQRWIEARGGSWQSVGSSMYRQDPLRYALKNVFCHGLFPKDEQELRERLKTAWK